MTPEPIFDQTQDLTGTERHRLTQMCPVPDFVKTASHLHLHGDAEVPMAAHLYANDVDRVYPVHTKAATWLSALFFADKRDQFSSSRATQIEQRLQKAASYWKMQSEVDSLWEKVAAAKQAGESELQDADFAFVWEADGQRERHYPLRNATEVKQASAWFQEHHARFTFIEKTAMASRILEKADSLNAEVVDAELLNRCAGNGYCPGEKAAAAWDTRAALTKTAAPAYAAQAKQLAASIRANPIEVHEQGSRMKMACVMDDFDNFTHIDTLYADGGLDRPEDILFGVTEKVASEFVSGHVQTINGAMYEKAALANLDIDKVQEWLGEDLADACGGVLLDTEKLAELVPTLPRPDADAFERMAAASNIPVLLKEKSAQHQGLSETELQELAKEYKPAPAGAAIL